MSDDALVTDVTAAIRDIPDFPKPGILFKDIAPVLGDPALFGRVVSWMGEQVAGQGVTKIVGMESRGFIFGAPLVANLGAGFVPARKPGKLPYQTVGVDYALEYGTARLEVHVDAIQKGEKVVVVDDLLATGGTAAATVDLVRRLGGEVVACVFMIELDFLSGRDKLDVPVHSLVHY
jgi:adenine phosphoribosyltransferase